MRGFIEKENKLDLHDILKKMIVHKGKISDVLFCNCKEFCIFATVFLTSDKEAVSETFCDALAFLHNDSKGSTQKRTINNYCSPKFERLMFLRRQCVQ